MAAHRLDHSGHAVVPAHRRTLTLEPAEQGVGVPVAERRHHEPTAGVDELRAVVTPPLKGDLVQGHDDAAIDGHGVVLGSGFGIPCRTAAQHPSHAGHLPSLSTETS